MPNTAAPATIENKIVDMVGYTNQALKIAGANEEAREKQAAACAKLIPNCVAALVKHERIDASEAEKCAQLLQDPVKTLELLTKLAEHRNTAEQQQLGTGIGGEKKADHTAAGAQVGRGRLSEADRKLRTGLGLVPPAE